MFQAGHGDAGCTPQAQPGPSTDSACRTLPTAWPCRGATSAAEATALETTAHPPARNASHSKLLASVETVSVWFGPLLQRFATNNSGRAEHEAFPTGAASGSVQAGGRGPVRVADTVRWWLEAVPENKARPTLVDDENACAKLTLCRSLCDLFLSLWTLGAACHCLTCKKE